VLIKTKFLTSILIILIGFTLFFNNYNKIKFENKIRETSLENNLNDKIKLDNNIPKTQSSNIINNTKVTNNEEIQLKEVVVRINKNQTFESIIDDFIPSKKLIYKIINEIQKHFDLRYLKAGQNIYLYNNHNNILEKIKLPIEKNINLNVIIRDKIYVKKINLKSDIEVQSKEYLINDSLYEDGINNNIPLEILSELIKLYSFDLDFQRDIKKNTKVSISYESVFIEDREDNYYGDIIYALIKIGKNELEYFKFITDDGYVDYFNKKGENVKKALLKTPLDGAKLSSGFGMRKHPISGFNKMHKGVDFAAPLGTPVYAGGNGTIEMAGRNGGYGNYIRIRHNNEYKTAYAHLSSFKKGISKGIRVNQGDIIGYVGNTGNSTGPHLHYEIIYQNKQINPLKLKLPSGKKLKNEELERFIAEMNSIYANHLNLLFE
tara:strand:- start:35 stop:1336 length:1302 start_codon:yes stop_codon:yes gene_type:complete